MRRKRKASLPRREGRRKIFKVINLSAFIYLCSLMQFTALASAQQRVSIDMHNASLENVLWTLQKESEITFFYSVSDVAGITGINAVFSNTELTDILDQVLKDTPLYYMFQNDAVVIRVRQAQQVELQQPTRVNGVVRDTKGNPMAGVSILVGGTTMGTATDANGRFELMLPARDNIVLRFSFLGMKTREIAYDGEPSLTVVLEEAEEKIETVIVTGYEMIRHTDATGSYAIIDGADLEKSPTQTIEQMMQGKLPGVVISNTSGEIGTRQRVRVRGTSTLLSNPEPVWVVDGIIQEDPVPFNVQELGNMSDNIDMIKNFVGNGIAWLNPHDIENITVLKDAAATVLYGVKAANGVIVINTKRGSDTNGRVSVNYSGGFSISNKLTYDKMNLMNSKERIDVSRQIYEERILGNKPTSVVGYESYLDRYLNKEISYAEFNAAVKEMETRNTDWMDILYRVPFSHRQSVSLSGGNDRINYYSSFNYNQNKGIAKGNDSDSYGASLKLNAKVNDKINVSAQLNGNISTTNGFYTTDPYSYAVQTSRTIRAYEDNGDPYYYLASGTLNYSILNELRETGNSNELRSLNASLNVDYNIIEGLRFNSTFGFNASNSTGESYASENSYYIAAIRGYNFGEYGFGTGEYRSSPLPHGGEFNSSESHTSSITWRNSIAFNKVIGKHRFGVMLGQELRSAVTNGYSSTVYGYFPDRGRGITLPNRIITEINNSVETEIANPLYARMNPTITDRKSNFISFYGSATYSFDERYVLSASVRTDASNRFGQDKRNRFQPVWSTGLRWNIHNEAWMKDQNILSELNLRVSYGWQGNVAENFGPDLIAMIPQNAVVHPVTNEYQLRIKSLPYADLRWEKTKTLNLGLDFGFLKNRITATVEYYHKRTDDMIVMQTLPVSYGVQSMPVNGGKMLNRGAELSLNGTLIRSKNITWSMSLNTSKNFNRIKSTIEPNNNWQTAVNGGFHKEGYAVSSFWVFNFMGLDPSNGYPVFHIPTKEENPNVVNDPTEYMVYAGTLDPDFTSGLNTVFRYKTFSLSGSFNLSIGGKRFLNRLYGGNSNTMGLYQLPNAFNNLSKEYVDRWRKPGDEKNTNIPTIPSSDAPRYTDPATMDLSYSEIRSFLSYEMYDNSNARVVDASFLRCNNLSLSYGFTEDVLKYLKIKGLSVSFNISNPFIIVSSEYKGVDPEVAAGKQPLTRTYTFGVNVSF